MRSGVLQHYITIEHKTGSTTDAMNAPIDVWATFVEAYADVKVVRGKEQFDQSTHERFNETVYRFRCRLYDVEDVTEAMRINFDGKLYDIKSVRPDLDRQDDCLIDTVLLAP